MNQFFSVRRFSLLVSKHWADNKKRYVLSVLAFIGLLITWFVFTMLVGFDRPMAADVQMITFYLSLFAVGSFYASQYFSDLGSRAKGINFLLVPASIFEKLLCSLLYTVVLFFAVFLTAFYAVDLLMVAIANTFSGVEKPTVLNIFSVVVIPVNLDATINFLLFFFSVQSAFLLGSVYFEKFSFIKTVISCFVGGFLIFLLIYFFNRQLLPEGDYPQGFLTSYRVHVDGVNDRLVKIPGWIGELLRFLVLYTIAPFFWIVTYYRLKEKQV